MIVCCIRWYSESFWFSSLYKGGDLFLYNGNKRQRRGQKGPGRYVKVKEPGARQRKSSKQYRKGKVV